MKKVIVMLAVLAIAGSAVAFHGEPEWKDDDYDCDSCHLPHTDGIGDLGGVPLWSGVDISGEEGGAPAEWTMYSSPTMDAVVPGAPTGSTLLCMACHDKVHSSTSGYVLNKAGGSGDLSTTHPVDFVYDAALADLDGELVNPDEPASSGLNRGTGARSISADLLSPILDDEGNIAGGVMRCTSCHEIHKNGLSVQSESGTYDPDEDVEGDEEDYEWDFDIPRLQPITGGFPIAYSYNSRRGNPSNEDDWSLNYGLLCKTCHLK